MLTYLLEQGSGRRVQVLDELDADGAGNVDLLLRVFKDVLLADLAGSYLHEVFACARVMTMMMVMMMMVVVVVVMLAVG